MSTTPTQKDQIISHLEPLGDVTVRPMMGEYLVYFNGTYFANICDGHLLVKITPTNADFHLPEALPYASAKRNMLRVDDLDNIDFLRELTTETLKGLPKPKPKSKPSSDSKSRSSSSRTNL